MLAHADTRTETIRLQVMGDVRVHGPRGDDVTPRSRKGLALVAFLALTPGRSAGRDLLLGLLWGDRGEEQARASLRQTLVDLRTTAPAVGALLIPTRQAVALEADGWTCDAGEVEAAVTARDPALLAAQLQTVRGELLQSLQGLTEPFDEWLLAERARRRERLVNAAIMIAQAPGVEREAARQLMTALMALDPGNEDACRLGMRLDCESGDLAALHRRYRVLEDQLGREFGAKPSPETSKLLRELTAIQPQQSAPVPLRAGEPLAKVEPPLLVVTPMTALDDSDDARSVALILGDELETMLARYRELRVLATARPDPDRLEAVTGSNFASYMIGGSVRAGTNGTRVNVRLSDIASGRVVWSQRTEVPPQGLAGAVDALVDQVVGAVLPALQRDLVTAAPGEASEYRYYYGAMELLFAEQSYASLKNAADLFERSIAADGGSVSALLRLSHLYNTDFRLTIAGHDPTPWRARALELVQAALRKDRENARATSQLGWCYLRQGDWANAERSYLRAIDLMPYNADIIEMSAAGFGFLGEPEQASRLMERAFRLNPFPSADYFADQALIHLIAGRYTDAAWQFASYDGDVLIYCSSTAAANALAGNKEDAQRRWRKVRDVFTTIWTGPRPPTDEDLRKWLTEWLPFKRPEHAKLMTAGLS